jgi:hypothetical protein
MAPRKKVVKKAEPGWDHIGKLVGKKFENYEQESNCDCGPMSHAGFKKRFWFHKHNHIGGGGCGRFLFISGLFLAFHTLGMFTGLPWQIVALIIIGFSAMKF